MSTRLMCGEEYPTASGVFPILYSLVENHLHETDTDPVAIASFKRFVKTDLQARFKTATDDTCRSMSMLSTFRDPRYRSLPFLSEDQRQIVHDATVSRMDNSVGADNLSAQKSESCLPEKRYESTSKWGRLSQDYLSYLLGCYHEAIAKLSRHLPKKTKFECTYRKSRSLLE